MSHCACSRVTLAPQGSTASRKSPPRSITYLARVRGTRQDSLHLHVAAGGGFTSRQARLQMFTTPLMAVPWVKIGWICGKVELGCNC